MASKKSIAVMTAGAGAGIAQNFILREYVDKVYGSIPGLEALGSFGTYSAIGGLVSGGITTAAGLISVLTGKITTNETIQLGLLGYGVPALSGAILSGVYPAVPAAGLRARAPPAMQIKLKAAGTLRSPAGQVAPARTTSRATTSRATTSRAAPASITLRA